MVKEIKGMAKEEEIGKNQPQSTRNKEEMSNPMRDHFNCS